MNPKVFLLHELGIDAICIKKPIKIDTKHVFKVRHCDKQPLLLQIDYAILCYKPIVDIYDNVSMLLQLGPSTLEEATRIEDGIISKISACKDKALIAEKALVCNLRREKSLLRTRNHKDNIACFDKAGKSIRCSVLDSGHCISVLVLIEHVWVSSECYGVHYKVVQVKTHEELFTPCTTIISDCKYTKMVKIGVPLDAVLQKMLIDQVPEKVRNEFATAKKCGGGKPPPPPPPLPPPPPPPMLACSKKNTSGRPEFLNDIERGAFKLKKVQDSGGPTLKKTDVLKNVDKSKFAPSLEEILQKRSQLKCLKKVYHSYYVPGALSREPQ